MRERNYNDKAHGRLYVQEQSLSELTEKYEQPIHEANSAHAAKSKMGTEKPNDRKEGYGGSGRDWYGGLARWECAVPLLETGWKTGSERIAKLKSEFNLEIPPVQDRRRRNRWADDGHTLNVDRAIAGNWDYAWRDTKRRWVRGPAVVDLVAVWGGNCGVSAEQMFWTGAQALILTDVLESNGYAVRLLACDVHGNGYPGKNERSALIKVLIKDAGEPVRMDGLAAIMCHAGIYRTLGFQSILQIPWDVGGGLGYNASFGEKEEILRAYGEYPEGVILPHAHDARSARKNIEDAIRTLQQGSEEAEGD